MKLSKKILLGLLGAVAIQFIPYGKDHMNPPVQNEVKWDALQTKQLFSRACADCHSNKTKWPWYSKIAPISWLVAHDVEEGREHFNVSMWNLQKRNKGNEAADELEDGEMPPAIYVINHPEAKLSSAEKQQLIDGLERTFGQN